jgi:hypothetical protein
VAGFGISGVESSSSATGEARVKFVNYVVQLTVHGYFPTLYCCFSVSFRQSRMV